jgi:hypothetical protein
MATLPPGSQLALKSRFFSSHPQSSCPLVTQYGPVPQEDTRTEAENTFGNSHIVVSIDTTETSLAG